MKPMATNPATVLLRTNMSVLLCGKAIAFGCRAWAQNSRLKPARIGRSVEVLFLFIAVIFWNGRHAASRSDQQSRQTASPQDSDGRCPIGQHGEGGGESRRLASSGVEGDCGA